MRARSILLPVAVLALAVAACQGGAGPLSDADVAAIEELRTEFVAAILSGDAAAVAALYTEDGMELPPNEAAREGRAGIEAAMEADGTVTAFQLTGLEVDGQGDLAYDRGTYSATVSIEGMPEPMSDSGKYIVIVRKQADGSWLLSRAIWNSNTPLPQPPM